MDENRRKWIFNLKIEYGDLSRNPRNPKTKFLNGQKLIFYCLEFLLCWIINFNTNFYFLEYDSLNLFLLKISEIRTQISEIGKSKAKMTKIGIPNMHVNE